MSGKDLELALRIKADLAQGQQALEALEKAVEGVGDAAGNANKDLNKLGADSASTAAATAQADALGKAVAQTGEAAQTTSGQLNHLGETAEQQAARIRRVVDASLQQQAAADAMANSVQRSAALSEQASTAWQANATAQTASANAYHTAARAAEQKALADQKAVDAAKQAALAMEKEGQELQQLLGRIDPVIRKLDELDQMEQQLRRSRASGQLDIETFDTFNAKLQEQRAHVGGASTAMRAGAISAGQYQQAMRQLPMQITDITTSLASGMPIWLVAVQQGGQIKDSFGGWANAGRALISTINPLTLAIAGITIAAGATIAAFVQGGAEAYEFEKAIALTGNSAGVSADRLAQMAQRIDGVSGTQRQAAAALAEVTSAGKFTAEQIELIGTTAVVMENSIGRAVSATVDEFKRLAEEPVEASAKLNEQYNYLTVAVYEQIAALEAQGDSAGAAQLAMESLASAMQTRAAEISGNLGLVESAWQGIKNVATEAWDAMLDVGRADTLEDKLAAVAQQRQTAMYGVRGDRVRASIDPSIEARLAAEEQGLREQIRLRDEQAQKEAEAAAANREAIAASAERTKAADAFVKGAEAQLQSLQKLNNVQRAQQIIEQQGIATSSEQAERMLAAAEAADQQKAANEAETESRRQATDAQREAERASAAALRTAEQATRQQLSYVQGLEEQATKLGMTAGEVREYDLAERGLAGAMRERAQAALVLIEAAERQREVDADSQQLSSMRADLLAAQGDQASAAAIQIEQRYGELMTRLQARGDQAGLDLVNSLINVEQAQAQLDQLNQALEQIFSEQARRESGISTEQQAGLISELGARQQILDLNKSTAAEVEKLLPKMRELAAVTGDPAAIERIKDLEVRLGALRTVANEFNNALKAGFETGIQSALQGLADGTMNLQEAAESFVQSIASSMVDLAAQQLSQMATSSLMGMFGGGGQADMTSGAAAVTGSAAALSTAGGSLLTGAAAIQAAATTLAAANGVAGASSVAGAAGSGASSSWLSSAASWAGSFFAEGGQVRGPGTGTSDSIPIWASNTEFITRAAVVTQPGALPFLNDFNARGMAALDDWAWSNAAHHHTGGLAGVPAPALPAPGRPGGRLAEPAASMSATLKNSQTFNLIDSPDRIAEVLNSPAGDQAFTVMLSRDPAKFRTILGL